MKKTISLLAGLLCVGSMAAPVLALTATTAGADAAPNVSGQIEICKALTTPAVGINNTATFVFTATGVSGNIDVMAGSCSGAISDSTPGGVVTITEVSYLNPAGAPVAISPTFVVTSVTPLAGQGGMGSYLTMPTPTQLANGQAVVTLSPSLVDTVTFTNKLVTGYVEVCKQAAATSGLTGTFSFTLSGADAFSTPTSVAVGACSMPILVPAGNVTVTEGGTNLYVTGIYAIHSDQSPALVGTANLVTGVATISVLPATDASVQTDITYTNNVVSLKVCKEFNTATGAEPGGASTLFPFTETVTSGTNGPNTAPTGVFNLLAGTLTAPICSNPVAYAPGTVVSITEGPVAGTKAGSITAVGAATQGATSLANATTSITVGNPITGSGTTDEAIVTFVDVPAAPGQLKICKIAGTPMPVMPNAANAYTFTVANAATPTVAIATATVSPGACVVVGGAGGTQILFPFNSKLLVTETATPGNMASAISAVPSNVTELVNGVYTASSQATAPMNGMTGVNGGADSTASAIVWVSEALTTEVDFTNVDPPVVITNPTGVTVADPGGANAGTTTAPNTPIATSVAAQVSALVNTPAGAITALSPTITKSIVLTSAQRKALLKKDNKTLATVKSAITKWTATAAHTKGLLHKTAEHRLLQLKAEAKVLNTEIKLLK